MAPSRSTPQMMQVTRAAFQTGWAWINRPLTPRATPPSELSYKKFSAAATCKFRW